MNSNLIFSRNVKRGSIKWLYLVTKNKEKTESEKIDIILAFAIWYNNFSLIKFMFKVDPSFIKRYNSPTISFKTMKFLLCYDMVINDDHILYVTMSGNHDILNLFVKHGLYKNNSIYYEIVLESDIDPEEKYTMVKYLLDRGIYVLAPVLRKLCVFIKDKQPRIYLNDYSCLFSSSAKKWFNDVYLRS